MGVESGLKARYKYKDCKNCGCSFRVGKGINSKGKKIYSCWYCCRNMYTWLHFCPSCIFIAKVLFKRMLACRHSAVVNPM